MHIYCSFPFFDTLNLTSSIFSWTHKEFLLFFIITSTFVHERYDYIMRKMSCNTVWVSLFITGNYNWWRHRSCYYLSVQLFYNINKIFLITNHRYLCLCLCFNRRQVCLNWLNPMHFASVIFRFAYEVLPCIFCRIILHIKLSAWLGQQLG